MSAWSADFSPLPGSAASAAPSALEARARIRHAPAPRRLAARLGLALLPALLLLTPTAASAHAFNPLLLELREDGGAIDVLWKVPATWADDGQPVITSDLAGLQPQLPETCTPLGAPRTAPAAGGLTTRWRVHCEAGGLDGLRVRVPGLAGVARDVLVRATHAGGREETAVLRGLDDAVCLGAGAAAPTASGTLETLGVYVGLGVEHIGGGVDHLLFVLGLVLLVQRRRALLATVTAFTVAHSLTLALTALQLVHLPAAPVEAAIAVSIALVALELARGPGEAPSWTRRAPWAVAGGFGLLHGFGFAGALAELGLPPGQIPAALLGFNLGVELGQLIFVAAVLAALAVGRRLAAQRPDLRRWATVAAGYAIGALATAWTFERVAAFWEVMG